MREVRRNATQAPLSTGQIGKGQRFDNRPSWRGWGWGQHCPASQAGRQTHRVPTEGTSAKSATRTDSSTRQFYFQKSGVQLCTHICEMTWVAFFYTNDKALEVPRGPIPHARYALGQEQRLRTREAWLWTCVPETLQSGSRTAVRPVADFGSPLGKSLACH